MICHPERSEAQPRDLRSAGGGKVHGSRNNSNRNHLAVAEG